MLYARGLWGLAHGDLFNPVAGTATLAVHSHLGLVVLAPLARLLDPLAVLVLAQAAAFGATMGLAVHAGLRALAPTRLVGLAAVLLAGLVFSSVWVANPFLFDVRPDLLAVPLATATLLRLHAHPVADRWTLLLGVCAVLMREEMAMTIAAAALVAPGLQQRLWSRVLLAALAVGLWGAYVLWGRNLLGGEVATTRLAGTVDTFLGVPPDQWWERFVALRFNRLQVLLAALMTLGGAALLGGRWLLAASPGVAWILVSLRSPGEALHYHYPLFAAPALLVAAIAGLERARAIFQRTPGTRSRWLPALWALGCLASIGVFATWSSWPGGSKFAAERYHASRGPNALAIARAHLILDAGVSANEGAVLPWSLIGARSNRSFLWTQYQLRDALHEGGPLPAQLDVIALIRTDALPFEERLFRDHGWARVTPPQEPVQIYRRSPAAQEPDGD